MTYWCVELSIFPTIRSRSHSDPIEIALVCLPQELKGNIRVFCRVRPLMVEEDEGNESPSVQFPSSTDLEGRAIELVQPSGNINSFGRRWTMAY